MKPYTSKERKNGKFVLHVTEKANWKQRLKAWIKFKKPETITKFVIMTKDFKNYNLVDAIEKARSFPYDQAVQALRRLPIADKVNISMVRWDGKNWLLI